MRYALEALSPIHIGSGDAIPPIEYVIEDKFYRVNMEALLKDDAFNVDRFIEHCKGEKPYLGDFEPTLGKRYARYQLDISPIARKSLEETFADIRALIKTASGTYIPGSSIKGAILSALYWHTLKRKAENNFNIKNIIISCLTKNWQKLKSLQRGEEGNIIVSNKKGLINAEKTIENLVFESIIKEDEKKHYVKQSKNKIKFATWLQITDTNIIPNENLYIGLCRVFGSRRNIRIIHELLKPKSKLFFTLKKEKARFEELEILEICDDFYSKILKKDMEWFKKREREIPFDYGKILNEEYKLRLGYGSSSLATSLLILAEELGVEAEYLKQWRITKYREPATRRIVIEKDQAYPLGWIKVSSLK